MTHLITLCQRNSHKSSFIISNGTTPPVMLVQWHNMRHGAGVCQIVCCTTEAIQIYIMSRTSRIALVRNDNKSIAKYKVKIARYKEADWVDTVRPNLSRIDRCQRHSLPVVHVRILLSQTTSAQTNHTSLAESANDWQGLTIYIYIYRRGCLPFSTCTDKGVL